MKIWLDCLDYCWNVLVVSGPQSGHDVLVVSGPQSGHDDFVRLCLDVGMYHTVWIVFRHW